MSPGRLGRRCAAAWLLGAVLAGCGDSEEASQSRETLRVMWETLRGPPSEQVLAQRTRFTGAGLSFDYPRPLRRQYERVDGDRVWSLRYGLSELEIWASADPVDGHAYLEAIAGVLTAQEQAKVGQPPADGVTVRACATDITAVTMRLQVDEVDTHYELLLLPPERGGGNRVLLLTDGGLGEDHSQIIDATRAMLLSTLACNVPRAMAGRQRPPPAARATESLPPQYQDPA